MSEPVPFEMMGDVAVARLTGRVSPRQATQLVTATIVAAREQHIRKLLVVMSGLAGLAPPGAGEIYFFIHEWARAAGAEVCVAVAVRRGMIDPEKFGVIVAANAGLAGNVFESEAEALAWLQGLK